jgi:hypothetical protein
MDASNVIAVIAIIVPIFLGLIATVFYLLKSKIKDQDVIIQKILEEVSTNKDNDQKRDKELTEKILNTHISLAKDIETINVTVASFGSVYATRREIENQKE